MTRLSVNINKIALLRNSRGRDFPSVTAFSRRCLELGAGGITLHPRPDQRHARYSDVAALTQIIADFPGAELNVEGHPTREFLDAVIPARPHQCTLVPDAPGQLTSDHGWNFEKSEAGLRSVIGDLKSAGIRTSVFVDHDTADLTIAQSIGADRVELYTEPYAAATEVLQQCAMRKAFAETAATAQALGLGVNAGHDLNLVNLAAFLEIPNILEVSIGHALVIECIEQGIDSTIRDYLDIIRGSQK